MIRLNSREREGGRNAPPTRHGHESLGDPSGTYNHHHHHHHNNHYYSTTTFHVTHYALRITTTTTTTTTTIKTTASTITTTSIISATTHYITVNSSLNLGIATELGINGSEQWQIERMSFWRGVLLYRGGAVRDTGGSAAAFTQPPSSVTNEYGHGQGQGHRAPDREVYMAFTRGYMGGA